jgi:hypothetical protein
VGGVGGVVNAFGPDVPLELKLIVLGPEDASKIIVARQARRKAPA